jgi:hypothetical protein
MFRRAVILATVVLLLASPGLAEVADILVPPPHRETVGEVVEAMRQVGVALPSDVRVYVYDTRASFRRGLIDEAYVAIERVDEIASFAAGLARPGRVLLHSKAARGKREWRRLIAHELTHVAQFAAAGGDGRADQWLAEGVAERVAFEVLERLGLDTLAERRARALAGARQHPGFVAGRLDLAALGSPREFTLRHQRDGSLETYQLSFLMADYLVERFGLDHVLGYFRACRRLDRERAFVATFGQSVAEFETDVLRRLIEMGGLERAPQAPQGGSGRPGQAVAPLDSRSGS